MRSFLAHLEEVGFFYQAPSIFDLCAALKKPPSFFMPSGQAYATKNNNFALVDTHWVLVDLDHGRFEKFLFLPLRFSEF